MITITELQSTHFEPLEADLIDLLCDAVDGGASVGYLAPLAPGTAAGYWRATLADVSASSRILLVAAAEDGRAAGSVQLALGNKENARHRGEVQKLLVHSRYRRQGIGRRLMDAVEQVARRRGVTLLVLDTASESVADQLYPKLGYTRVGVIPNYALSTDGKPHPTALYFKELSPA